MGELVANPKAVSEAINKLNSNIAKKPNYIDTSTVLYSGLTYPYTATQDCWLIGDIWKGSVNAEITIDSVKVAQATGNTENTICFPIKKGQIVGATGGFSLKFYAMI